MTNTSLAAVFFLVAILSMINGATPQVEAKNDQIISPKMNGLLLTSDECCPISSILNGTMTKPDGPTQLSLQTGTLSTETTKFKITFVPTGSLNVENDGNTCSSGSTYEQTGNIDLIGSDGSILRGTAYYTWGSYVNCSGANYQFTYLNGQVKNDSGVTTEFYTASDLIPTIQ